MENCSDCRYVAPPISEQAGAECVLLVTSYPAQFMRREDGICGPAAKSFERKHIESKPKERRK